MNHTLKWIMLLFWLCGLPLQAAINQNVDMSPIVKVDMRQHGYHLGDMIEQKVQIQHSATQVLDSKSLPLPGPVTPWLDLKAIKVTPAKTMTVIELRWQIFATVETAQELPMPAFSVNMIGQPAVTVKVPSLTLFQSPVFGHSVNQIVRKPSRPPLMYALTQWKWLTIACLIVSAFAAVTALWLRDRIPGLPFRPGPLLRVKRKMLGADSSADEATLKMVYQALCACAGQTLHNANTQLLFERASYLSVLQPQISEFVVSYSRQAFGYRPLDGQQSAEYSSKKPAEMLEQLRTWLPKAVLLERVARKTSRK